MTSTVTINLPEGNPTPREAMTLRQLLAMLNKQQGGNLENVLDVPMCIGVSDGHMNFDSCTIFSSEYPRFWAPEHGGKGGLRIDCHTNMKRLVNEKKGAL